MTLLSRLFHVRQWSQSFRSRYPRRRPPILHNLERLETREMLTTFLVISTDDTTDAGTLRWAIEQANNNAGADNIEFDASFDTAKSIVLGGTQLPKFTDTTGLTKISGPGLDLLTISGNDLSRVLWIDPNVEVQLSDLTIHGANADGQYGGGVLLLSGSQLTVDHVQFVDNHANYGGAIYVDYGATLEISSSRFENNAAGESGGAIDNLGPSLKVSESILTENSAKTGGAIANLGSGSLELVTVVITKNTATLSGGGIAHYAFGSQASAVATIVNCEIGDNTAQMGGGIATDTVLTLINSQLSGNSADGRGGGIYNYGTIQVSSTLLSENSASGGGAIANFGTLTVETSTINHNSAGSGGAGIFSWGTLSVVDSDFNQNESSSGSGAIENLDVANIQRTTFTSNHGGSGGGVGSRGNLNLVDTVFHMNTADHQGGAVTNSGRATIYHSTFTENQSVESGGAISNGQFNATLLLLDATLDSNTSALGGAIENAIGATLNVDRAIITHNSAEWGGGILNDFHSTLDLANTLIADNEARVGGFRPSLGGGLANRATAHVINSTIARNSAQTGGGIYHGDPYFLNVSLVLQNVTVADNQATGAGGGLFMAFDNEAAWLVNTIVGRNVRGSVADDIDGTVDLVHSSHNLIGPGGSGGLKSGNKSNLIVQTDSELGLGELADNGGFSQTMALLPSSPAVDAGLDDFTIPLYQPGFDQRYADYVQTFTRFYGTTLDLGAFELQPGPFDALMPENSQLVPFTFETQSYPQPVAFALSGGADQALFSIDPATGALSLLMAPDYENPADANSDNTFEIQVSITDNDGAVHGQVLKVHVTNIDEGSTLTLSSEPATYELGSAGTIDPAADFRADGGVTSYSEASLVVSISEGRQDKDLLKIAPQGTGSGQIKVKKNKVLFGGVVIGTIDGGVKTNPNLTIRFNTAATEAAVRALVKRFSFSTKNKGLPQPARGLQMQIIDLVGSQTNVATHQINVVAKS